jgi:hypothetical protein
MVLGYRADLVIPTSLHRASDNTTDDREPVRNERTINPDHRDHLIDATRRRSCYESRLVVIFARAGTAFEMGDPHRRMPTPPHFV